MFPPATLLALGRWKLTLKSSLQPHPLPLDGAGSEHLKVITPQKRSSTGTRRWIEEGWEKRIKLKTRLIQSDGSKHCETT